MANEYSPYHQHIFDRFKHGGKLPDGESVDGAMWFANTCAEQYGLIAKQFGCDINISLDRLGQARFRWLDDIERIRVEPGNSENGADHFKLAGFLAHWLRRRVVVESVREHAAAEREPDKGFLIYGNEVCAFAFGFQLCLFFEMVKQHRSARSEILGRIWLPPEYLRDAAILLNQKEVSPHALYLIYRSLFYSLNIPPPVDVGNVTVIPNAKS